MNERKNKNEREIHIPFGKEKSKSSSYEWSILAFMKISFWFLIFVSNMSFKHETR